VSCLRNGRPGNFRDDLGKIPVNKGVFWEEIHRGGKIVVSEVQISGGMLNNPKQRRIETKGTTLQIGTGKVDQSRTQHQL